MTESNRRHSACKADALPTELITHSVAALRCEDRIKPFFLNYRKLFIQIFLQILIFYCFLLKFLLNFCS